MKLTIEIHDGWLGRPEDLRKILTTLAGLECPPAGTGAGPRPAREDLEEPSDPEDRPRGRNGNGRYPGDDDRSQASDDIDEDRRRTRRRTGGSSWAGPPSRCPTPRGG